MALKAGRYGLKKKMLEKLLSLPGIKSIGEGLYLNASTGELSATGGGGGTTVVANPEGAATSDLNKLQVGESIYDIPEGTDVEANPEGSATSDLTKLKVGTDIYEIPEGTDVEANPAGSATNDLTKLKVGTDIYSISAGSIPYDTGSGTPRHVKLEVIGETKTVNASHTVGSDVSLADFLEATTSSSDPGIILEPFVSSSGKMSFRVLDNTGSPVAENTQIHLRIIKLTDI